MCSAIISGVISGLISTGIIYFLLFKWKLNLSISPQISRSPDNGDYRIKIVNLSHAHAVDLNYTISVCVRESDYIAHIFPVELVKTPITDIQEYQDGELSDYAIRIAFRFDEKLLESPYTTILFRCYATHAVSGTISFLVKSISRKTLLMEHLKLEHHRQSLFNTLQVLKRKKRTQIKWMHRSYGAFTFLCNNFNGV